MKILLFDNYDSFTYNLLNQLKSVRPDYDFIVKRNKDRSILELDFDVLVISPGPMTPDKTGILKELFGKMIIPNKIPVLGICLGMQFMGYYFSSLKGQECPVKKSSLPIHGNSVFISTTENDIFDGIDKEFRVARYNSLEIKKEELDEDNFILLAEEKERNSVMGIRHKVYPFAAVQFHPESFLTENGDKIINNFFEKYVEN